MKTTTYAGVLKEPAGRRDLDKWIICATAAAPEDRPSSLAIRGARPFHIVYLVPDAFADVPRIDTPAAAAACMVTNNLEELESALSRAEAALCDAVFDAAGVHGDQDQAKDKLDKARAYCRQIRAALDQLRRAESLARSPEYKGMEGPAEPLEEVLKQGDGTSALPEPPQARSGRGGSRSAQDDPAQRSSLQRSPAGLLALKLVPADAPARQSLLRQSISMLILILAYLQYNYIDAQLQITSLRSIFEGTLTAVALQESSFAGKPGGAK